MTDFGNMITNVPARLIEAGDWEVRYRAQRVRAVSTYAEGRRGELVALAGSTGYVELALPNGSAARRFHAKRGEPVELCHRSHAGR